MCIFNIFILKIKVNQKTSKKEIQKRKKIKIKF